MSNSSSDRNKRPAPHKIRTSRMRTHYKNAVGMALLTVGLGTASVATPVVGFKQIASDTSTLNTFLDSLDEGDSSADVEKGVVKLVAGGVLLTVMFGFAVGSKRAASNAQASFSRGEAHRNWQHQYNR